MADTMVIKKQQHTSAKGEVSQVGWFIQLVLEELVGPVVGHDRVLVLIYERQSKVFVVPKSYLFRIAIFVRHNNGRPVHRMTLVNPFILLGTLFFCWEFEQPHTEGGGGKQFVFLLDTPS